MMSDSGSDFSVSQSKPFLRHLLLAVLVTLAIVLLFPRVFLENDDLGFIYLLGHGFYAPWISKSLSWLWLKLYAIAPGVAWYGVLHYLILALDMGLLMHLVEQWAVENGLSKRVRNWLVFAVILLFFPFILRITFTCSSILSGGLGLLAFLAFWRRVEPSRSGLRPWLTALGLGFVFSLCYLVRPEGMGAMIFLLPALVMTLLFAGKRLFSMRGLSLLVAFLLPVLGWVTLDRAVLRYPAEQTPYLNFVEASNDAFGFGYTEQFKNHPDWLAQLGWSRTDYGMLERFLYWDETVFSQARIDQVNAMAPMAIRARVLALLNPLVALQRVINTLGKTWLSNYPFTLYCIGLFALFAMMGVSRRQRVFPWLALGWVFLLSVAMQSVLRFPYRVAYPVITLSSLSLLALPGYSIGLLRDADGHFKRPARNLLIFSALALLIFNGPFRLVKTFSPDITSARARLADLDRIQADHYILREAGVIQISASDPLSPMPLRYPEIGPGWLIRSVPYYQRLAAFGLKQGSQLIPASFQDSRLVYFFKDKNLPFLQTYIQAHYQRQVEFIPEDDLLRATFYKNSHLYRLKSLKTAGSQKKP